MSEQYPLGNPWISSAMIYTYVLILMVVGITIWVYLK